MITIERGDFLQQVSVVGTIAAAQNVNIALAQGGQVASVPVKVGDVVKKGQQLLAVNTGSLQADLRSAKADVALKQAEINNKEVNIGQITAEQDTFVENTYRTMLSDDLTAVRDAPYSDIASPTITGRYAGPEGTYRIRVYNENRHAADYRLLAYGVERGDSIPVSVYGPTILGSYGLYVSFPDGIESYMNTYWEVDIPNKKSGSYLENYNAYKKALETRNRTIADARENLAEATGTSILRAQLAKAQAQVQSILADIADRMLRAPFAGLITKVDVSVGEIAAANQAVVEMISEGAFQIESYVPEIYIALVAVGDEAEVTLDSYGSEKVFTASVISIDPSQTVKDGVSTYRIRLELDGNDLPVREGMTANVVITTDKKSDVITIPQGVIMTRSGKKFVTVRQGEKVVDREVVVGSISSNGQAEIIKGLSEGDVVVVK